MSLVLPSLAKSLGHYRALSLHFAHRWQTTNSIWLHLLVTPPQPRQNKMTFKNRSPRSLGHVPRSDVPLATSHDTCSISKVVVKRFLKFQQTEPTTWDSAAEASGHVVADLASDTPVPALVALEPQQKFSRT